jgi:predicted O-methyltransferase YrrM
MRTMSDTPLRRVIARTPLARAAAFPHRLVRVARHDARVFKTSARWLFTSREHHNYTYDLTKISRDHLVWYVSVVCGAPVGQVRRYVEELEKDQDLRRHIERATATAARRGLADRRVRYARRLAWYAIARAAGPAHVVETGVDKGLGSCVLAAALVRNAAEGRPGRVTCMDINPEAGYLVRDEPWSSVVDLVIGDSIASIAALDRPVDLFLHDSDHSVAHERNEFEAVEAKLAPQALLITDNARVTSVLSRHAERTGRRFLAYRETPADHWFPGEALGVAFR